jgi:hypothetical protein
MIKLCVFMSGLLAATPVFADIEDPCADLWFSRNAMLDQAGYCFATPLGKAIFDNSDCTTKEPVLSHAIKAQIAEIIELEQGDAGGFYDVCNVDTSKQYLELEAMDLRKQLDFQPATDGGTGICIGYLGADIPLHSAPWVSARRIGVARAGDLITHGHLDWNGWSFSLIGNAQGWTAAGWYKAGFDANSCEAYAG